LSQGCLHTALHAHMGSSIVTDFRNSYTECRRFAQSQVKISSVCSSWPSACL